MAADRLLLKPVSQPELMISVARHIAVCETKLRLKKVRCLRESDSGPENNFTISEVAADWHLAHKLMIPHSIGLHMRPSIARAGKQLLDQRCSMQTYHHTAHISHTIPSPGIN